MDRPKLEAHKLWNTSHCHIKLSSRWRNETQLTIKELCGRYGVLSSMSRNEQRNFRHTTILHTQQDSEGGLCMPLVSSQSQLGLSVGDRGNSIGRSSPLKLNLLALWKYTNWLLYVIVPHGCRLMGHSVHRKSQEALVALIYSTSFLNIDMPAVSQTTVQQETVEAFPGRVWGRTTPRWRWNLKVCLLASSTFRRTRSSSETWQD